ncbi:hypothetical protein BEWA_022490 [Theileria equi strain WA]|uniref:Uncharacterized protein n=1 Tax=Theileria equi strain WA TaxID=1537102 RepID=L0AWL1_THEEQ|nr:hypothetical protein BEWA_022490 [Theileria equi strain WA]AFZ79401.1 hypothetical protein BEWA_022490 [Theileria equi strain WA]|eukprot:XP_004829067.1 hypothetical protein BEWA_022490 [Theileria equi strain WA]
MSNVQYADVQTPVTYCNPMPFPFNQAGGSANVAYDCPADYEDGSSVHLGYVSDKSSQNSQPGYYKNPVESLGYTPQGLDQTLVSQYNLPLGTQSVDSVDRFSYGASIPQYTCGSTVSTQVPMTCLPIESLMYDPPEQYYYGYNSLGSTKFIDSASTSMDLGGHFDVTVHPDPNKGLDDKVVEDRRSLTNMSTCDSTPVFYPTPREIPTELESLYPHNFLTENYTYVPYEMGQSFEMNKTFEVGPTFEMSKMYDVNQNFMSINNAGYNAFSIPQPFDIVRNMDDASSDDAIMEIANEIARNMQFLPDKDGNGKYSLDKNHPIHCVWRDLNRGHCSWRCRWWENGKRLSKNFNVKRFGDHEAMRMAITMKIRNSTPVERLQLLKEQREAVRNHLELLRQQNRPLFSENSADLNSSTTSTESALDFGTRKTKTLSNTKKLQRDNWNRLSWTYVKPPERKPGEATIICRLCAKTTRCSRSRNLQQAHIMHLIRMHKNPWKQYIHVDGLTKMCKAAIEALYQQQNFNSQSKWRLRPGLKRPEPAFC